MPRGKGKGKGRAKGPEKHSFRNKLLLNQWLVSLFGIDPLLPLTLNGFVLSDYLDSVF